jgi:hypothetical protein
MTDTGSNSGPEGKNASCFGHNLVFLLCTLRDIALQHPWSIMLTCTISQDMDQLYESR